MGLKNVNHAIHKTVRDITEQYQNIEDHVKFRKKMLSQFKIRVTEYERQVEEFTQWLTDCCKRIDKLPVADISTDGPSQLNDIQVVTTYV